ncbi:hypothetical protein IFM89_012466, partial [Coptis chinensis]
SAFLSRDSYGQGPIVNWLRLGCLETLRSCIDDYISLYVKYKNLM